MLLVKDSLSLPVQIKSSGLLFFAEKCTAKAHHIFSAKKWLISVSGYK